MTTSLRNPVLAALLVATGAAQAATFAASGRTHVLPGGADDVQRRFGDSPVAITVQGHGSQAAAGGSILVDALGRAWADMNGVHLWAGTSSVIDSLGLFDLGVASVAASASMGDSFTITSSSLASGASFTALVGFHVAGGMASEADSAGNAESRGAWSARMVMRGPSGDAMDVRAEQSCHLDATLLVPGCSGDNFATYWTPVSFTVGGSYSWSIQGDISSNVNAVRASRAVSTVDLGHTLAWGGLKDIRDAQGQALGGIQALSASTGFDYVNAFASATPPVPEPGTWALMLGGLAAVASSARRRRG